MSESIEVRVPDIGDFKEVEVIEVMVKAGDAVKVDQSLLTVESDKASMEIPCSAEGTIKEMKVRIGDKVSKGSLLLVLQSAGSNTASAPPAPKARTVTAMETAPPPAPLVKIQENHQPQQPVASGNAHASPSVRKLAREFGIALERMKGTGPKQRITHDDIRNFVKSAIAGAEAGAAARSGSGDGIVLLPWPKVDFEKFGPVTSQPLSRIKKVSGANLYRNWVMIPHVTNNEDADITELEAFRMQVNKEQEKSGRKLTMLAFLVKTSVAALRKFPEFNASLDGDNLILKNYFHIGFAADTPNGLVVPVICDADKKGVLDIAQEMSALAARAREGKLAPSDMQGGCFSISSLGGIGGTSFTPIINAPEVAILGVSKSAIKPVWNGKEFVPRLILPLSLSWDHRVIDGAAAGRFNAYLASLLADYRRILL